MKIVLVNSYLWYQRLLKLVIYSQYVLILDPYLSFQRFIGRKSHALQPLCRYRFKHEIIKILLRGFKIMIKILTDFLRSFSRRLSIFRWYWCCSVFKIFKKCSLFRDMIFARKFIQKVQNMIYISRCEFKPWVSSERWFIQGVPFLIDDWSISVRGIWCALD